MDETWYRQGNQCPSNQGVEIETFTQIFYKLISMIWIYSAAVLALA